jgi:hypothetical protein
VHEAVCNSVGLFYSGLLLGPAGLSSCMPAQVLLPLLQVASAVGFGSSGIIVLIFLESSGPKKTPPPAVRVPVWERDVTPAENGHEGVSGRLRGRFR